MSAKFSVEAAQGQPLLPAGPALFGHVLVNLGRQWRRLLELRLAELGLTDATWVPLFHLHAAGSCMSLKSLAHSVGLDSSSLVRVVDLLEARGLLLRETDLQDRRSKLLHITPAGREAIADVLLKLEQVDRRLLAGMDQAEVQSLQAGMEQLTQRLVEMLHSETVTPEAAE